MVRHTGKLYIIILAYYVYFKVFNAGLFQCEAPPKIFIITQPKITKIMPKIVTAFVPWRNMNIDINVVAIMPTLLQVA